MKNQLAVTGTVFQIPQLCFQFKFLRAIVIFNVPWHKFEVLKNVKSSKLFESQSFQCVGRSCREIFRFKSQKKQKISRTINTLEKNSGQNAVFFHITSIQDLVFDITINIFDNYGRCTKMLIKWGQTISMLNIKSAFFRYQYHQFHYYYISMRFHTTLTTLCQCKSLKDFPGTITHVTEK